MATLRSAVTTGESESFPKKFSSLQSQFKAMKTRREDADYDAQQQFKTSEVRKMLELVESTITSFKATDRQLQLHFAFFVALKKPRLSS